MPNYIVMPLPKPPDAPCQTLYLLVMEDKADISRPLRVVSHKVLVSLWPLLLRVARKHTLQAHAYTLHVVYRRPARAVEQIEADDAVRVNVRVPGDGVGVVTKEYYFGGLIGMSVILSDSRPWLLDMRTSIGYWGLKLNFSL